MKNLYPIIWLVLLMTICGASVLANESDGTRTENSKTPIQQEMNGPLEVEVILQTNYADGVSTKRTVDETIWAMEDFWNQYANWQLVDQEEGRMIFERNIEDLSPASKETGHFGLTEDGILSIFDGRPADDKVIQTFFQIDVGKLESSRREQLMDGIPVESWYHFESMLQAFYKVKAEKPVQ